MGLCLLEDEIKIRLAFQHIVVRTARPLNLRAGDWVTNGVGKKVSHSFGFGLMDAGGMVRLASNWTTVPEQRKCVVFYPARYKLVFFSLQILLKIEMKEFAFVRKYFTDMRSLADTFINLPQ